LRGNKNKWSALEDQTLNQIVKEKGPKDWTAISEKLNENILEHIKNLSEEDKEDISYIQRNGKQCRERWITSLDPSINKSQWSMKEDIEFLELWINLGNKWREIANMIDGRTESQIKNRFKLLLRREHIQQSKIDPNQLRSIIIP
jgi:hypothetical protein